MLPVEVNNSPSTVKSLANVVCNGMETDLTQCTYTNVTNCAEYEGWLELTCASEPGYNSYFYVTSIISITQILRTGKRYQLTDFGLEKL